MTRIEGGGGMSRVPSEQPQGSKKAGKKKTNKAQGPSAASVKGAKPQAKVQAPRGAGSASQSPAQAAAQAKQAVAKGICRAASDEVKQAVSKASPEKLAQLTDDIFNTVSEKTLENQKNFMVGFLEHLTAVDNTEAMGRVLKAMRQEFPELTEIVDLVDNLPGADPAGMLAAIRDAKE